MLFILVIGIGLFTSCANSIYSVFYLSTADSEFDLGEYEKAIEYYDKALELNPDSDKAYIGKARAFDALGKYEKALEFFDKAIEINGNSAEAYNAKGITLANLERYEESFENLKKAMELEPSNSVYQNDMAYGLNNLRRFEEAIQYAEKALELNPRNSSAYTNKGYALEALGKTDEAIKCYDKAIQLCPTDFYVYYNKALTVFETGKTEEAIELLDKALEIEPDYLDAITSKGYCLNELGEYEKAIACFDTAIKKYPKEPYAYVCKATSLYYLGKYDEALKECDKAIQLKYTYPDSYICKAKILSEKGDFEEARKLCDEFLALAEDASIHDMKGKTYLYEYNYSEALKHFDKAIEVDPLYEDSYINKIYCLYQQKNYKKCIEFAANTQSIFPNSEDIPWYIGDCYSVQQESEKAIEYYKKAHEINPENIGIITSIAWEYYTLQDYEKASEYAEKAAKISADDEGVKYLKSELDKQKLPESERIVNFVKDNYLYYDKIANFDAIAEEFKAKGEVSIDDICKFIESIRQKDDVFTFVIHGNEYDLLKYEESISQVTSQQLEPNIHYIKINSFTASVSWEFKEIIDSIENPEDKVLVIDLRDNLGGLTTSSTDILDYLLPSCTTSYIVYRDGYMYSYYSDAAQIKFKKILVLVNEYSASSSEILALGLKKYLNNVVIIGHPTVGKGVGQLVYEDKAKKYVVYLVSFYWNVMEENIMGKRIVPDVYVRGSGDTAYMNEVKRQASK
nr:tetratricopeptide repeat protein [Acetivibrio straminisolvens]